MGGDVRHISSKVDGAGAVVDAHLHVIVPHTVHNSPLQLEAVGEGCQAKELVEADALINLGNLLQQPDQGNLSQGTHILSQSCLLIRLLDDL